MATTKSKVSKTVDTEKEIKATTPKTDTVKETAVKQQYRVKQNLDPNMIVSVRNGFHGTLVYVSKHTQEQFVWSEFGDEQDMDLHELKNVKNASKKFFENNWFLIDDPSVIEYLGVAQYYKNALSYEEFDDVFYKEPDEIKSIIAGLSTGQKKSVAYRAKQLISEEAIDSIKVINALEESLSVELIER